MSAATATSQQGSDPAALIRRWFEEVWNQRREAAIDELLAPDVVMHGIGRPSDSSIGSADFKKFYHAILASFPNTRVTVDQVAQEGDTAFARWTVTGQHTGEGMGFPATNQHLNVTGFSACRVRDGKIVEAWNIWDQIGMARQLGMLSGPAATLFP